MRRLRLFLLALILLGSLAANLVGIDWGLPFHWHTDEKTFNAVEMINRRSLDPQYFINPHLHLYALTAVVWAVHAVVPGHMHFEWSREVALTNPNHPNRRLQFWAMRASRALSALFAVATVFVMYRIGRRHFGEPTGLLAAAFLAMTMGFVELAHYATPESLLFLVVMVALASFEGVMARGRTRDYLLAGALVGLALTTKYTVYLLAVPFLAAHLARGLRQAVSLRGIGMVVLAGLAGVAGFLAGTPYAAVNWKDFWEVGVVFNRWTAVNYMSPADSLLQSDRSWLPYLGWLADILGPPLFVMCLLGVMASVVRLLERRGTPLELRGLLVHVTWVLTFYAVTGAAAMHALRYIMPMVPSLVLLGAVFSTALVKYASTSRRARIGAQIAVAATLVYSVVYTARADWMFLNDTRYTAGQWLSRQLVRASDEVHYFALDSYIPYFDQPHFVVRLIPVVQTPHPIVNTPDLTSTFWSDITSYMHHSTAVIVDSNFYYDRYLDFRWRWPDHDVFYRRLLAGLDPSGYKPIARFTLENPWWLNPRPERVAPEIVMFGKPGSITTFKSLTARP